MMYIMRTVKIIGIWLAIGAVFVALSAPFYEKLEKACSRDCLRAGAKGYRYEPVHPGKGGSNRWGEESCECVWE